MHATLQTIQVNNGKIIFKKLIIKTNMSDFNYFF